MGLTPPDKAEFLFPGGGEVAAVGSPGDPPPAAVASGTITWLVDLQRFTGFMMSLAIF